MANYLQFRNTEDVKRLLARFTVLFGDAKLKTQQEIYAKLLQQLVVGADGQTYLLDDILRENDDWFKKNYFKNNKGQVLNGMNTKFHSDTLVRNTALAHALLQIILADLTEHPFPLHFKLPESHGDALITPGINFEGDSIEENHKSTHTLGYYTRNLALDELIQLRFNSEFDGSSYDKKQLHADIEKREQAFQYKAAELATRQKVLEHKVNQVDLTLETYPKFYNKSRAQLDEMEREIEKSQRRYKIMGAVAMVTTYWIVSAAIAIPALFLMGEFAFAAFGTPFLATTLLSFIGGTVGSILAVLPFERKIQEKNIEKEALGKYQSLLDKKDKLQLDQKKGHDLNHDFQAELSRLRGLKDKVAPPAVQVKEEEKIEVVAAPMVGLRA